MRAWMRGVGLVVPGVGLVTACALPPAMPVTPMATRRLAAHAWSPQATLPPFRYEQRATPAFTIAGRVIDDSTGLPLPHRAAAWLTERTDSSTVDAWGHFDLAHLAPGRYTLVTSADGYAPRIDVVELGPDGGAAVEVRLVRNRGAVIVQRSVPVRGSAVRVAVAGSALQQ